jgi:hypothetical protein
MAADDTGGGKPAGPVVLRIKLRYDDVDAMVQRFAPNVGKSGLFLPTKSLQPVGTEVKFELRITNDTPVLVGLGRVKSVRPPDPANPKAAFGMAIELMRVTREGREVIIRMIERRRAMGLADVAIPMPEDVETAKRADVETQPRADVSGIVRTAHPKMASEPVLETGPVSLDSAPIAVRAASERESGVIAAVRDSGAIAALRESGPIGESLLTSPRPSSGPFAVARGSTDRTSAPALAPEPARAKRPRLADVLAKAEASGPLASAFPGEVLDEQVDVARALARARALATGTDLDAELAALRETAAAPLAEISVEAASAELARQLGGVAVRRDRSARWAPPPAVESSEPAPARAPHAVESSEPVAAPAQADYAAEHREAAAAAHDHAAPVQLDAPRDTIGAPPVEDDAAAVPRDTVNSPMDLPPDEPALREDALGSFEHAPREFARPITSSREMDQLAAEAAAAVAISSGGSGLIRIERPDEAPVEPQPYVEERHVDQLDTPPSPQPALLIDDDADLSSFERALDAARIHTGVSAPAPAPAIADDEDIAELDSMDLEELPGESTHIGDVPVEPQYELAARLDQQLVAAEAEADEELSDIHAQPGYEPPPSDDDEFNAEEISDLDVLAEADADDDDLLQANGEREASDSNAAVYAPPPDANRDYGPPGVDSNPDYDFAAALDLGDDEAPPQPAEPAFDDFDRHGELPSNASSGYQLNQYEPTFDQPSEVPEYTFAEQLAPQPSPTFDDPHGQGTGEDFDEPHHYGAAADPQQFGAGRAQSFGDPQYTPGEQNDQSFDEPHGFSSQTPPPYRGQRTRSRPDADYDLENALSALEPDLDALEIPHEQPRGRPRPLPGMPPERADSPVPTPAPPRSPSKRLKRSVTEDEGVLIDFDDDDE